MSFPNQGLAQYALAVEGDFASSNPRRSVNAGAGAFVSGASGVSIGRFAWLSADGVSVSNTGTGVPIGFVAREQQATISAYLAEFGMVVPQGQTITLFKGGDFWVKNSGTTACSFGSKVFVSNTTGVVNFAQAGATVAGFTETKWTAQSVGAANELVKISSHTLG